MAIRYAVATGNWSNVATWDGGATLPTIGDTVYSNTFVVTINQDILVDKITNNICPTTGLSGGSFKITSNRNILCIIESFNETCLTILGIRTVAVGELKPINACAIYFYTDNVGISQLTVMGDCSASDNADTIEIQGNGAGRQININITGNGNSTASKQIINNLGGITLSDLNVTGNFESRGGVCFSPPSTSFNGVGSFKASATASVVVGATTCRGNISGTLENINSRMAVVFNSMYLSPTTSLVWTFYDSTNSAKPLYTADVVENPPAESDVRAGVAYGIGDAYTGTLDPGATTSEIVAAIAASELGTKILASAQVSDISDVIEAIEAIPTPDPGASPAEFVQALKDDELGTRLSQCSTGADTTLILEAIEAIPTPDPGVSPDEIIQALKDDALGQRLSNCSTVEITGAQIAGATPPSA